MSKTRNVVHIGRDYKEVMLRYDTGNAAFEDVEQPMKALQIDMVTRRVDEGELDGPVMDINGNKVGTFAVLFPGTLNFCRPWESGLDSTAEAVARRLGHLLSELESNINGHVCKGPIVDLVRSFRLDLHSKLKAEGWRIKAKDTSGWRVLPPKAVKV